MLMVYTRHSYFAEGRDAVADCHRRTHQFDCLHHFLNVRVINFFLQPLKKRNV